MRIVLFCLFFIATSLSAKPVAIEWKWSGPLTGFFYNLVNVTEWIYCLKHGGHVLYVNSQNAYSHSEAVYPLLFKIDEDDPQIIFKPRELFVPRAYTKGSPSYNSPIRLKKFASTGMKNFRDHHIYSHKKLFEDPDFHILRENLHPIIQKYMQPVSSLQKRIDTLVEKMGQYDEKIGIHVRATCHYHNYANSSDDFLKAIEANVDQIMASKDRDRTVIYLATLLEPLVKILSAKYNVISIDIPRSQDVTLDWTEIPNEDPLDKARDAIVDAWALSTCDEFWCGSSNMSIFICSLNPKLNTRLLPCLSHYDGE